MDKVITGHPERDNMITAYYTWVEDILEMCTWKKNFSREEVSTSWSKIAIRHQLKFLEDLWSAGADKLPEPAKEMLAAKIKVLKMTTFVVTRENLLPIAKHLKLEDITIHDCDLTQSTIQEVDTLLFMEGNTAKILKNKWGKQDIVVERFQVKDFTQPE